MPKRSAPSTSASYPSPTITDSDLFHPSVAAAYISGDGFSHFGRDRHFFEKRSQTERREYTARFGHVVGQQPQTVSRGPEFFQYGQSIGKEMPVRRIAEPLAQSAHGFFGALPSAGARRNESVRYLSAYGVPPAFTAEEVVVRHAALPRIDVAVRYGAYQFLRNADVVFQEQFFDGLRPHRRAVSESHIEIEQDVSYAHAHIIAERAAARNSRAAKGRAP